MFYIFDAGAKIHTPLENLLKDRDVQAINRSAPVRAVDEKESSTSTRRALVEEAYHESDRPPPPRHRVRFAREIMTTPVITGTVDQSLNDIWKVFAARHVHHLPLLDRQGQLRGIVSDRDITRFAANASHLDTSKPIGEIMTRRVITTVAEAEVRELAEVLVRRRIGAIPVIGDGDKLEGIVSRTDILRTLVHRAPLELWS